MSTATARALLPGMTASCRAALAITAALLCPPAAADLSDTLNVVAGGSIAVDSNVLRQPASSNPQKDTIRTAFAGLRIDKLYSLQRFQFDFTKTRSWFDKLPERNNEGTNYRGAWLWSLTPRISGTLSTAQVQSLVQGDETRNIRRNVRTTKNQDFTLDGAVSGGWHLLSSVTKIKQTSEAITTTNPNFEQNGWSAGVLYESASGNSISAINYKRHGEYLSQVDFANLFDNHYEENESELKLIWKPSGRSVLIGRLAWLQRHHEIIQRRDFSGPVGKLDYNVTLPGKLSLGASAIRAITVVREPFSSYRVDTNFTISPRWQVSEKVSVQTSFYHAIQDYRGPVRPPPGPLRRDIVQSATLSAIWAITPTNSVNATLLRQRRDSNQAPFDFYDTFFNIGGSFSF